MMVSGRVVRLLVVRRDVVAVAVRRRVHRAHAEGGEDEREEGEQLLGE
jgi:hypothetical protein